MLLAINLVTDEGEEGAEIFRGGIAGIDNKAGMLLRDLCSADGDSFQAALFDQCRSEIPLRAAESAAGGREIQRLLIAPALVQLFHAGRDRFSVSGC